jgi:hypothetical protein
LILPGDILPDPPEPPSWQESFYESFEKYREKPYLHGRDPGDENDSRS